MPMEISTNEDNVTVIVAAERLLVCERAFSLHAFDDTDVGVVGLPHFGHAGAASLTSVPQSEHLISAMIASDQNKNYRL